MGSLLLAAQKNLQPFHFALEPLSSSSGTTLRISSVVGLVCFVFPPSKGVYGIVENDAT